MKRLLRILLNVVTVVSLVVCVVTLLGTAGLFAWKGTAWNLSTPRRLDLLYVDGSILYFERFEGDIGRYRETEGHEPGGGWRTTDPPRRPDLSRGAIFDQLGVKYGGGGAYNMHFDYSAKSRMMGVHLGTLAVAAGLLPAVRGYAYVRRRLLDPGPGLCPACGYDLRATPDRCPECGTVSSGDLL